MQTWKGAKPSWASGVYYHAVCGVAYSVQSVLHCPGFSRSICYFSSFIPFLNTEIKMHKGIKTKSLNA